MDTKLLTKIFTVLITIILVSLLLTQVSLKDLISTITHINPVYLIAGFILYTCSYLLRAWRFQILLNNEVKTRELFPVVCVHNMMNSLLPARTGELSYVYLLKKVNNRTTGEGIATLLIARIFDVIALAIFFFFAILLVQNVPQVIYQTIWLIGIGIVILLIVVIMLLWRGRENLQLFQKVTERIHINQTRGIQYLLRKGYETMESVDLINIQHIKIYCLFSSLLIWGFNCGMIYFLLLGMGINLSYVSIVIGTTFILLTTILPIQGIAGFGTTELIWTLVFVSLGLSMDEAIISGFSYHIFLTLFFMVLGIYGWLKIRRWIS